MGDPSDSFDSVIWPDYKRKCYSNLTNKSFYVIYTNCPEVVLEIIL